MKKLILYIVLISLTVISSPLYSAEESDLTKMIDNRMNSQFFCGYCHVLTYPKVIKKAYNSWKQDKHKDVPCIDCHYPPERLDAKIPEHKKIPKDKEETPDKSAIDFT